MTDQLPVPPPTPPPPVPPPPAPARPLDGLWLALGLVTRLPVPAPHGLQPAARFAGWLGPAGLIAGGLAGLVLAGAAEVFADRWIAALLALIAAALIGGLIHEDGLADVADGFGGGRDRVAKLEIMKDSRVGTFGAGALILGFGLRAALYAALAPLGIGAAVLAAGAGGLSRAAIGLAMAWVPPARRDRPGLADAAGRGPAAAAVAGLAATLLITAGLAWWALDVQVLPAVLGLVVGAAVGALVILRLALRQIGGTTGDVYGALQQAAEIGALLLAYGGLLWWP